MYAEKLLALPSPYLPNDYAATVRSPALAQQPFPSDQPVVLCALHHVWKLDAAVLALDPSRPPSRAAARRWRLAHPSRPRQRGRSSDPQSARHLAQQHRARLARVTPGEAQVFAVWMDILRALPAAALRLQASDFIDPLSSPLPAPTAARPTAPSAARS